MSHSDGQNNSAKPYGEASFLSFGPLTAYVARRAGVLQLWYMHNDCKITFKLGLAAIRSLYVSVGLLTARALRGVKQFDNCISAWPYHEPHRGLRSPDHL